MTAEQKMTSRQEERQHLGTVTLTKGIVIGVIGSLAGTIAAESFLQYYASPDC